MKILLIIFATLFVIDRLWINYLRNNITENLKLRIKGGSLVLGLIEFSEMIVGIIIVIKIILRLWK